MFSISETILGYIKGKYSQQFDNYEFLKKPPPTVKSLLLLRLAQQPPMGINTNA